jgi:hypothetical protein
MRPISGRLPLHWLARWHSCPKFQLPLPHPRYPAPRHLHLKERGPDPGPLPLSFHLPWRCFLFPASRQFLRHRRPLRRAGRIWRRPRLHRRPRRHLSRASRSLRRHIRRQALRAAGPGRIHGRLLPIFRMNFFLSPVFRVRRPQVFPKRLCRNRVHRRPRPRLTSRLLRKRPSRFLRSPMPFNRLCFRKTLLIWRMRDELRTGKSRQHFPPSLRCFLSLACPVCSLPQAFQFCLRQCRRGLQLKPIFASCPLRSLVHPQPRRPLAFRSPRSPVSPAKLPMRKEHRNSPRLCQRASNRSSSVPI